MSMSPYLQLSPAALDSDGLSVVTCLGAIPIAQTRLNCLSLLPASEVWSLSLSNGEACERKRLEN